MKYFLSFAVCLLTVIGWFSPQNAEAQKFRNPKGPEFWVGFMNNNIVKDSTNPLELALHIFADRSMDVVIEVPGYNFRKTVHVENYAIYSFDKDPDAIQAGILKKLEDINSNIVQKNGIRVFSTKKEHFFLNLSNRRRFTFDVALALPLWAVNTDYLIPSYAERFTSGDPSKSEFMLVAVEDSTEIDIIPRGDVIDDGPDGIRRRNGIPYTLKLNRGETYQAMSNQDLTGSSVKANKPISVFSGNQCTNVGNATSCDHLFEAVLPLPTIENKHLYTKYVLAGGAERPSDVYRIMAVEESTTVKIYDGKNTPSQFVINNAGGFINRNIETIGREKAILLESDKPVMVSMFNLSDDADAGAFDNNADPFMTTLIPQEMAQSYYGNFYIMQNLPRNYRTLPWRHFLNLIHPIQDTASITLNGDTLTNIAKTRKLAYRKLNVVGDSTRVVSVFEFPETMEGPVALRCSDCIDYIYGYTFDDGYGTAPQIGMYPVVNVDVTAVNPLVQNATEHQVLHIVPNPMGKSGNFELNLTRAGKIDLEVYDLSGKLHRSVSGNYPAGKNVIPFEQKDLPSGIYFIKVKTADSETHTKMVIGQ